MKRAKQIITLATIASLTLGSAMSVLATARNNSITTMGATSSQHEFDDTKVIGALEYTSKYYVNNQKIYGEYPVIRGMNALNSKIERDLDDLYRQLLRDRGHDVVADYLKISFEVEDLDTLAKITVTSIISASPGFFFDREFTNDYYVNKDGYTEVSEEQYLEAIPVEEDSEEAIDEEAAEEEAIEEETVEEDVTDIILVPLRENAEALGLEVTWNASLNSVEVSIDDFKVGLVVDKNAYTDIDGKNVELDAAPENIEGVLYVPTSFFEILIGAEVVINEDDTVEISIPEDEDEDDYSIAE